MWAGIMIGMAIAAVGGMLEAAGFDVVGAIKVIGGIIVLVWGMLAMLKRERSDG